MKKIILFLGLFLWLCAGVSHSQEMILDDATKEICNKVILNIYNEIYQAKGPYDELDNFDEKSLFENKYGLYTISYKYDAPQSNSSQNSYEILITTLGINDQLFRRPGVEDNHYGFPVLGLRVSSYLKRKEGRDRFLIDKLVQKNIEILYDHQQKYLPLEVILRPTKNSYKVGERLEFEVTVKNRTNKTYTVKSLSENTVSIKINQTEVVMNAANATGSKSVVLGPNGTISRVFKSGSFKGPGEVEIFCTYSLGYKGILPFGRLKIKIES